MSDDIFDSVIHIESQFINQGAEEGKAAGEQAGFEEGRSLGFRKGYEVAQEFGSYYGHVQGWLHLCFVLPDKFPARALRSFEALKILIEKFKYDPTVDDIMDRIEQIRAKYRHVSTLAGAGKSASATAAAADTSPASQLSF